jgi:hypothetical protein
VFAAVDAAVQLDWGGRKIIELVDYSPQVDVVF